MLQLEERERAAADEARRRNNEITRQLEREIADLKRQLSAFAVRYALSLAPAAMLRMSATTFAFSVFP